MSSEEPAYVPVYSQLVLSYAAELKKSQGGAFRLENSLSGRGVELGEGELEFLRPFSAPALPESVIAEGRLPRTRAEALVHELRRIGVLTPVGLHNRLPEHLTIRPQATLFQLPFAEPDALHQTADFCFYGVPYESGRTGLPGAALGPDALRGHTQSMPASYRLDTGHCSGWFDADEERPLLSRATLLDLGNAMAVPGEAPADLFERTSELVRCILGSGAIPVGLGGDHSITAPILRGFGGRELTVVQFDAHTDLENRIPPEILHHGNVMRHVLELPGIREIRLFGFRGVFPAGAAPVPPEFQIVSSRKLQRGGVPLLLESLKDAGPLYVTVDLDVLDPVYFPSVGTPLPGGLSPTFLKDLLWAVGTNFEVVGLDFVELSPRDGADSAASLAIAADLLLTLTGAVYHRLYGGSA